MDYWELFDLRKDPHELLSVYDKVEYAAAQKELHAELKRLRVELKVPEQDPANPPPSARQPKGKRNSKNTTSEDQ